MTEKQVARIKVGQFGVGIIGIKELMEEMAEDYANKDNKEIQEHMLEQLGKSNYIPSGAREEYGIAFLREFRKFMGQPYEEESTGEMEIKILGPGCPQCDQLEKIIMELLAELNLPAGLEHVRDMKEIARYRIMSTPALLINGKVMAKGNVPSKDKIRKWVTEAAAQTATK
ncbi:thioredoxin family protein [Desulfoferrobacter suflitae]|uniref:thioredoxin family protein n=1 Tax=Desulfoferrobacter suflitae TaxID=2865782 RepID=UPI00216403A7|nr:thioredoxin family protein [Desulfoferrobacter suflitae]MCK8603778.1 thioredoxin family protein [Desulfoferrobacter suflitae]